MRRIRGCDINILKLKVADALHDLLNYKVAKALLNSITI